MDRKERYSLCTTSLFVKDTFSSIITMYIYFNLNLLFLAIIFENISFHYIDDHCTIVANISRYIDN